MADNDLIERLRMEAQIHAQEARAANATIAEIYQLCSGGKGEPGNWHGAEPVRALIAERDALAATLRQQAGRVDEVTDEMVERAWLAYDESVEASNATDLPARLRIAMRAAITAALAQNTQGEKWLNGAPMWGYIHTPATGKELVEREEAEARIAEAERARVPDGMAEALEALRPFANAYHRLRSYGDNPTDETPLYAYFGEGHPLYELLDGEHGPCLTVQSLEKAAAALTAAPSQRAEVK